jgi:hypothetical protein
LRRIALVLVVIALLPHAAFAQTPGPQIEPIPDGIKDLLVDYGRAWVNKDDTLLAKTLSAGMLKDETHALDNAREIDFRTFRVHALTQYSGNLAYERIRALYPSTDVRTYHVSEDTAVGTESKAYSEDGAFTFAHEAPADTAYGGWRLISKSDLDVLGFFSPHNLWDEAAVAVLRSAHFVLLTHPDVVQQVRPWLAVAEKAYARASAFWPGSSEKYIVIEVPSTTQELGRITHDTADLGKFVAFVAAGVNREHGYMPTGPRMFAHISHLLSYPEPAQVQILSHELIHALTREVSGPNVTTWIEEGLANVGGGASDLFSRAHLGPPPSTFPTSEQFVTGDVTQIQAVYAQSQIAIQVLIDKFGRDAMERFYKTLGAQRVVVGTEPYHVRKAVADSLHWSYDEWVAAWRKRLG